MALSKLTTTIGAIATLASLATQVAAHGYIASVEAGGTTYTGFLIDQYPYMQNPPDSVGWATNATDHGFVDKYDSPDIICHKAARNAKISATVAAGEQVTLKWDQWPESHKGPMLDYLANCNGDCATVDKTSLQFVKIDEAGLLSGTTGSGQWASDKLIADNSSWTVTIPASITAGNYVLRHETIALHSAGGENGAQSYPQCINLEITGGGNASPAGTLGTELYSAQEPGMKVNIYGDSTTYEIPGPAVPPEFASGGGGGAKTRRHAKDLVAA